MKKIHILAVMIGCAACAAGSFKAAAQDTIRFTWQAGTTEKRFRIEATKDETFTIDWGDGNTTQHIGQWYTSLTLSYTYAAEGDYNVILTADNANCRFRTLDCFDNSIMSLDVSNNTGLEWLYCPHNQLTSLNVSNNAALTTLSCSNNQLTSLDVSSNTNLGGLFCSDNQLTSLDLSKNTWLWYLSCSNNHLSLSKLYAASEILRNNWAFGRELGSQTLPSQVVPFGVALFTDQSVFNTIFTDYTVTQNSSPASPSDYTIKNGQITFNAVGAYTVTMTNAAIISSSDYPVVVTADLTVTGVGISEMTQEIPKITVYPNPTTSQLRITNYELRDNEQLTINNEQLIIEIFDVVGQRIYTSPNLSKRGEAPSLSERAGGEVIIDISHLASGIYFVKIGTRVQKFVKQ